MSGLLFLNGRVFDGHRYVGSACVAVRDGRIVAVGDREGAAEALGRGAQEVDLEGGLLLPGFQDAHVHPLVGGLERLRCDLTGLSAREEYLEAIRRFAADHPEQDWVRGGGWSLSAFPDCGPLAADLDAVVGDRPVFLPSNDHHDAWVSSRAMELAGVDASTPDPPDGWLLRDEAGRPTGTLREAAMALVQRHLTTNREARREALLEAQRFLHSHGITGWQDALLGGYAGLDDPTESYLDLLAGGRLTGRVRGALWWDRHRGVEQVGDLVARREELRVFGLDAGSVKVMVDGIAETFTAAVLDPYEGVGACPCGDRGLAFVDPGALRDAAVAADAAGFQLHFHAIGDRAVRGALDAVEHARASNGPGDHRHHVAHLQMVDRADRDRFARLDVVANVQGLWADANDPAVTGLLPHLGERRWSEQYPFGDLARAGARLAGGSDWPVDTPAPMRAVHALVNRRGYDPEDTGGARLGSDQGLELASALAAYTSGSAFVNHLDDTGRVAVGFRADLAALDRDPFDGPADRIGAAQVRATYVDGTEVFRLPSTLG